MFYLPVQPDELYLSSNRKSASPQTPSCQQSWRNQSPSLQSLKRQRLDRRSPNRPLSLALLLLAVAALAPSALLSSPMTPPMSPPLSADEALIELVQAFLHQQLGEDDQVVIEVHLPAAQMPPCTDPQPFLPNRSRSASGRISIGLRCGEQGQQVRYLQANVSRYGHYPVLKRAIAPGTVVTAAMLRQRQGNLSDLPREAVLEPEAIIGRVARRAIAAEVPLQHRQFETKPLVERGQLVSVEARGTNFRVSREGKALDSGGLGDQVRVQFGNRDLVTGRVVGEAKLVVDF